MKIAALMFTLALGLGTVVTGHARSVSVTDADYPRSLPEEGPVSVTWTDPNEFSEIKFSGNSWEAKRGNWVVDLAEHLRESAAKQLAPGETLSVNITDITRAGHYEPGRGPNLDHVRIVRDMYPPRMELSYVLRNADGQIIAESDSKLADTGFLMHSSMYRDSDMLRYEKNMIDDWTRNGLRAIREPKGE
ncbi:hypothetical protein CSC70_03360 [Pseudoxanthomonas kalamensis DSM 18571]|uniref:DUF3016 domain-containing protein n=1 Tax=Pseudoxanthomonas kalamensis TaxID=289483 RepID=UPI001390C7CA|nr:DUF3016 domain-containing protein [Pseudoxanthomonas kalamensis]KAF1712559.1 hypothetical protein CSC70_03360 [Pseudoxanthomonas kalamensis DSM 18571]